MVVRLAAVAALSIVIAAAAVFGPGTIPEDGMDPHIAHERASAGEIVLVDVRNPDEWQRTGIGAAAVPISMGDPAFLDKLMAAVDGDLNRPVAVICAAGGRSTQVAGALAARGFTAIHNVREGMMGSPAGPGWLGRGLPVKPYPG